MDKIIFASNNKNKIVEITSKLSQFGIEVVSQKDAGIDIEVEETGKTFAENAFLKANEIYNRTKIPVIADDSGLEIDCLDGFPGVYSARFAGENASDDEKIYKILEMMKDVDDNNRTARFVCNICFIDEAGNKHDFLGTCDGIIAREKHADNGFGYDPIFMVGDKCFSEISREEKNQISHRGRAIDKLVQYLKENV